MKKKILLLAVVAMCLSIFATGSLAYFTAEEQVHNVITSGAVDIELEEWQQTEGGLVPYPSEPMEVMPGATVSKIATVRNIDAEAWIRAKIQVVFTDPEGNVMDLPPETLDRIVTLTMNGEDWQLREGDSLWWYYAYPVAPGASTEALFTEVVFDGPNMTNEYQNCTLEVFVTAQAVQTANNGETVHEAAGWPAE